MTKRSNPWLKLGLQRQPYVHDDDLPYVTAFNKVTHRADHQLVTGALPEPWVGKIHTAPIVVLSANPGWTSGGMKALRRTAVRSLVERNLSGKESLMWLDPAAAETPGADWYRTRLLKDLLRHADEQTVADKVCLIDFHGYHSRNWQSLPITLPTQHYAFDLVRARIEEGALVIITRAARDWTIAVPELLPRGRSYRTNNPQQARLSENNLPLPAWRRIVKQLEK